MYRVSGSKQVKNKYWYCVININIDGTRKQKWISTHLPEKNNATRANDLVNYYVKFFTEHPQKDLNISTERFTQNSSFIEYARYYYRINRSKFQKTTLDGYYGYIDNFEKYCKTILNKDIKLKDITEDLLKEFYNYQLDIGLKPITCNHYMTALHPVIKKAYKEGLFFRNPIEDIHRYPKDKTQKGTFYSFEEIQALYKKMKGWKYELFIRASLELGTRCSETLGIKFSNINFEEKYYDVQFKVIKKSAVNIEKSQLLKNGYGYRRVYLSDELIRMIKERQIALELLKQNPNYNHDDDDFVFVDDNGNLFLNHECSHRFSKFLEKNGFRHMRLHDCRGCLATNMINSGISLRDVQAVLGHGNCATTATYYIKTNQERVRDSFANFNNRLFPQNPTKPNQTQQRGRKHQKALKS